MKLQRAVISMKGALEQQAKLMLSETRNCCVKKVSRLSHRIFNNVTKPINNFCKIYRCFLFMLFSRLRGYALWNKTHTFHRSRIKKHELSLDASKQRGLFKCCKIEQRSKSSPNISRFRAWGIWEKMVSGCIH